MSGFSKWSLSYRLFTKACMHLPLTTYVPHASSVLLFLVGSPDYYSYTTLNTLWNFIVSAS